MRAKSLAARQSGRIAASDGRRTPPARTSSVTLFSRNSARPLAAAPSRHQACGTSATVAGSAAPSSARTKTSRPAARQDSMRRRGSPPPPAMMPSLSVIASRHCPFGWQMARLESARMNATMSSTGAIPPKRSATSSTRSLSVPSSPNRQLIGAAQALDVLAAEAAALHADDVEPDEPRAVAHHLAIGDDVALDPRHAADHRMPADADELMHRRKPAENGIIADDDMAAERRVVGHDDVVADLAVMRDMRPDHEQAIVADPGDHAAAGGAGVHRHMLADRVVAADVERDVSPSIFQILRSRARSRRTEKSASPRRSSCARRPRHAS